MPSKSPVRSIAKRFLDVAGALTGLGYALGQYF